MSYTEEDTIFVLIGCYRDPELQWTLKDLFEKAKKPENIFVGICLQYDMKDNEDKHLFEIPFSHPEQLRIYEVDYRNGKGCCWSKSRAQKLWKNEKWILMVDGHTRFKRNWDEILVNDIQKLKNPLITCVLDSYNKVDNTVNFNNIPSKIRLYKSQDIGVFRSSCGIISKTITNGISFYGNFVFADAKLFNSIKINPYLLSNDEVPFAITFFTNGGNIYYYNKMVLNHLWLNEAERKKDISRQNTFLDSYFSNSCFLQLTNVKKTKDPEVLQNIKEYGLGNKRTLRDYERFSGVDFRKKITKEHTKQGIFEEWQEVSKIVDVKKIFNNLSD